VFAYLVLNARRPLFAQTKLRQAVNDAIDRRTLTVAANAADPSTPIKPTSAYLQPGILDASRRRFSPSAPPT
jgi:ABC-type oligopeptide transport system substrate-binding subunit